MTSLDERRIFVVATASAQRAKFYSHVIQKHISNSVIYVANTGMDAIFKMGNTPPHVLITDSELPKHSGNEIATWLLKKETSHLTAIIIVSPIPDHQNFVDEVVVGCVQYLTDAGNETALTQCLTRALNFLSQENTQEYRLRFLSPQEVLFKMGEAATSVYIVRKGELEAFVDQGPQIHLLGKVQVGEFVGEMAHLNEAPRSATVRALTDCELIEIPTGKLDLVLFSKPAWSKALIQTLSKRLKKTNESIVSS